MTKDKVDTVFWDQTDAALQLRKGPFGVTLTSYLSRDQESLANEWYIQLEPCYIISKHRQLSKVQVYRLPVHTDIGKF